MNKAELVDAVAKTLGSASRAEAERAVTAVIDGIRTGIRKDKSVQLVGFGTFRVAERAARMGINPKTGREDQNQEVQDREIFGRQGTEGQSSSAVFLAPRAFQDSKTRFAPRRNGFLRFSAETFPRPLKWRSVR